MALQVSIFLLSASAIAYEILLMRLLSMIHWQHFAAMIISLALLGYGASGTFLTLARRWVTPRFTLVFASGGVLFAFTSLAMFVAAQELPFNPLEIPWSWRQLRILAGLYLLFAVPFFCVATSIGAAFAQAEGRIARLYRADLAGAGTGAVAIMLLLSVVAPGTCLKLITSGGLLAAAAFLLGTRLAFALPLLAVAVVVPLVTPGGWPTLRISEFKPLSQMLRIPGARVVEERSSPLGFVSVVESREVPFRFAPGLSLNYVGELPEQVGLFTDAAALTVINRFAPERLGYLDFMTAALPYHLSRPGEVIVMNAGGGSEVLSALQHGARRVHALELNPEVIDVVARIYTAYSGEIYRRPEVRTHARQAREFLATIKERFDLIVDSSGAAAGVPILTENYLYTIEGIEQMIQRLDSDGMLAITRQVNMPPRDTLKLVATVIVALERLGIRPVDRHLVMIRGWNTATLLVKKSPLTTEEVRAVRRFCEDRSFDVAFYPGMPRAEANRYNLLDEPFFYDGIVALVSAERRRFLENYKFNLTPATDNRPYFAHFFKWRTLPELIRLRVRGGAPLLEIGYLLLVATVVQAVIAGAVLIVLPIVVFRRAGLREKGSGAVLLCFLALGLGFLFIEIVFIQKLTLLLGHPLLAIAIALAAFLVFAGLGSGYSEQRSIFVPAIAIAALVLLYTATFPILLRTAGPLPTGLKVPLAIALIAPLGFFMGMPFPIAMTAAGKRNAAWIPWAWSINGCASVVSPVAATLLAVHLGFAIVSLLALVLYLAAVSAVLALQKIRVNRM